MQVRLATCVIMGTLLLGCDSSALVEPALLRSSAPSLVLAAGLGRASGHADIVVTDPILEAKPEQYSFTARRTGEALVDAKGQMEFRSHRTPELGGTIRVHAEVVCLGIDAGSEHHARIGAVVRRTSNETHFPLGSGLIFGVTDNGEGRRSPPDLASSPLNFPGSEDAVEAFLLGYCEAGLSPPQLPSERGNLQVRVKG